MKFNQKSNSIDIIFTGEFEGEILETKVSLKLKEPISSFSQEYKDKQRKLLGMFHTISYATKERN